MSDDFMRAVTSIAENQVALLTTMPPSEYLNALAWVLVSTARQLGVPPNDLQKMLAHYDAILTTRPAQ